MELRQLEYFVAVAEEANFTRAAQRIHVAQPAVSAQIQRLERELGEPLLDRSRRSVRLTAAGEAALPYARAALAAAQNVATAIDEISALVRGTVTIGTVASHNVDIPALLADFHAEHPAVEITLNTANSDALIEKVRTGQLDAAIVSVGQGERPEGLDTEVVTDEVIDAAVCRTDDLASRSTISLTELADRPLIALPVGHGYPPSTPCGLCDGAHLTSYRVRGQHAAGLGRPGRAGPRRGHRAQVGGGQPRGPARVAY